MDISHVSKSLLSAATSSIPHFSRPSSHSCRHIKDAYLSTLCWCSRDAFRQWKEAGRPRSEPVFEKRKKCKKDISLHLSKCRARLQCISIQKRDESFRSRHPKRFQSHSQKTGGTSLQVSGILSSLTLLTSSVSGLTTSPPWENHTVPPIQPYKKFYQEYQKSKRRPMMM